MISAAEHRGSSGRGGAGDVLLVRRAQGPRVERRAREEGQEHLHTGKIKSGFLRWFSYQIIRSLVMAL